MKVLQVITRAELGGGQRHVLDLVEGLKNQYEVEVATGEEGFLADAARNLGVTVHIVPNLVQPISPLSDFRAVVELSRLIDRTRPGLVHTHTSKAGTVGRMAARWSGVPCLFTAHTWCFAEGTSWKWKLIGIPCEKLVARWSSAIVNVSEANRQLALQNHIAPGEKLLTIHNGISDSPHRANPGSTTVPRIVMVARFAPQKAQADLLRAILGIEQPLKVTFVGDGPMRAAHEELARGMGLRDRIEYLGERLDIPEILASAHIFALPTNWEGFPLSILEGMRAGLPVVASNVGGNSEAIVHDQTGFLVPARDTDEFRNRLRQLISNPGLRAQQGAAGRARFEREFTVAAMLEKTVAVYRSIQAKGRSRSAAAHSPSYSEPSVSPRRSSR